MFVLTNLPADEYVVTIQSKGFAPTTANVTLQVGQNETLNTTLKIGNAATGDVTVSVDGDMATAIDTETSVVDGVVSRREIAKSAAQRPQFSRTGITDSRQQPGAKFRSHEEQHGRDFFSRSTWSGRQCHG